MTVARLSAAVAPTLVMAIALLLSTLFCCMVTLRDAMSMVFSVTVVLTEVMASVLSLDMILFSSIVVLRDAMSIVFLDAVVLTFAIAIVLSPLFSLFCWTVALREAILMMFWPVVALMPIIFSRADRAFVWADRQMTGRQQLSLPFCRCRRQ
jgi:hypothetical protein